jgi:hypothetical protein
MMVMIYSINTIMTGIAIIFVGAVVKVWRLLSDQKYLRQNEISMMLKVGIAILNALFAAITMV